jgi:hypothetical protein
MMVDDESIDREPSPEGEAYAVGYGKPPKHSRFGNPKGKVKGTKGLKAIVAGVFHEKVSVRTPTGVRKVTKLEALVQRLMNEALTGKPRAIEQIVRLAKEAGLADEAEAIEAASEAVSEEDQQILERYFGDARSEP